MTLPYVTEETSERVARIEPELTTRFAWRAERTCNRANARRLVPFYRWEIIREDARWKVVAFQNRAVAP
jgi:hypothetical protein